MAGDEIGHWRSRSFFAIGCFYFSRLRRQVIAILIRTCQSVSRIWDLNILNQYVVMNLALRLIRGYVKAWFGKFASDKVREIIWRHSWNTYILNYALQTSYLFSHKLFVHRIAFITTTIKKIYKNCTDLGQIKWSVDLWRHTIHKMTSLHV